MKGRAALRRRRFRGATRFACVWDSAPWAEGDRDGASDTHFAPLPRA
jgi:hypothetical protein